MRSSSRIRFAWAVLAWGLAASPALAQRVYVPTQLPPGTTYPGGGAPAASLNGSIEGWDPYASQPPPSVLPSPYQPPGAFPSYGAAPTYPASPVYPADPYYGSQPPAYATPPAVPGYIPPGEPSFFQQPTRFLQTINFDYTFLYGQTGQQLGDNAFDISATFAVPLPVFRDPEPLLVTPGFGVDFLDGPTSANFANFPNLPPRLFSTYLELGWRPRVNEFFSGDLAVRIGWYSDFDQSEDTALRVLGRGLAFFHLSPRMTVAAGVVYLDRNDVKLLPAGGLIWTPNPDVRWEITFPQPKLAQRLGAVGNSDTWWYVAGEYGGGNWTVEVYPGIVDSVDINDIRVALGLEWFGLDNRRTYIEVGYVFDREVVYRAFPVFNFNPDDTVMLRAGVRY